MLGDDVRQYYVYILASRSRTLYTGVTNDLSRRLQGHRSGVGSKFAAHYRISRLVYCEVTEDVRAAIAREKQIKAWRREKKVALIESVNPTWEDLSEGWIGKADPSLPSLRSGQVVRDDKIVMACA